MELIEEVNTMIKNKKLVLSSIAIVFALVVCSIFVNFTMANSDSTANVADANSGSTSKSLTGYSNIDLAIINSNNTSMQKTGDDKFRILQIVPDSNIRDDDTNMTKAVNDAISAKTPLTAEQIKADSRYANTSYLWRYVYAGQFFRTAVFDKYKTIDDNMAVDAVTLTTCTPEDLNYISKSIDEASTEAEAKALKQKIDYAKNILEEADLIYIWTDNSKAYTSAATDINSDVYSWLENYATAERHPLALCWKTLGTDDPSSIKGNNDGGTGKGYNMSVLSYKLMTKEKVARYDNVLVTDELFFKNLFEQGSGEETPDVDAGKTLYKFITESERDIDDGGHVGGEGTYFKWYRNTPDDSGNSEGLSLDDFLTGKRISSDKYSAYRPVGQITKGVTYNRIAPDKGWDFDNAKILVITDSYTADNALVGELKANGASNMVDQSSYVYNGTNQTWESVKRAANSKLTSELYSRSSTSLYIPSGVDIYTVNSSDLSRALGNKSWNITDDQGNDIENFGLNISYSNSYYMDVQTKFVSGTVRLTDTALENSVNQNPIDPEDLYAYLIIEDSANKKIMNVSDLNEIYRTPLIKTEQEMRDDNGEIIYDQEDNPVKETVYKYEFAQLSPEYNYKVVIDGPDLSQDLKNSTGRKAYQVGVSITSGNIMEDDDNDIPTNQYVYDFNIKYATEKDTEGYVYRDSYSSDNDVEPVTDKSVANTMFELADAELSDGYVYTSNENVSFTSIDFSNKTSVISYVDSKRLDYIKTQNDYYKDTSNINLDDFDFIFIDDGDYREPGTQKNAQICDDMYSKLGKAVDDGVYFIVSDKAGKKPGNSTPSKPDSSDSNVSSKQVADIINAGVYRDGSDNKFKVLEIQPDYPIDVSVAEKYSNKGSKYSKHMDGSDVKGDYYTTPSDVVEGKSKEELPSLKSEYYQFDLTKAKLAYALKSYGIRYSDIELTQVSTEALIGMKDDISTTYDLVYIGGDISAVDRNIDEVYSSHAGGDLNNPKLQAMASFGLPTYIMYSHTGILELIKDNKYMPTELTGSTVYIPENGNDLTKTKYDELVNYINSNKPIIFSNEVTKVYDNINNTVNGKNISDLYKLQGWWYNQDKNDKFERRNFYLDPSSRMYDLLEFAKSKMTYTDDENATYENKAIVWGYDPSSSAVQMIPNEDKTYGNTLYSYLNDGTNSKIQLTEKAKSEGWYDSGKCIKSYAVVPVQSECQKIIDCVKAADSRVRILFTEKPSSYKQGIESSYLKSTTLEYDFQIKVKASGNNDSSAYAYKLYVDKDRNSVYDSKDYTTSGVMEKSASQNNGYMELKAKAEISLDEDFSGSVSWYLAVYKGSLLVAEESGLSKLQNDNVEPAEVRVLQIQSNNMTNKGDQVVPDTFYFDTMSQQANRLLYYNTQMENPDLTTPKLYQTKLFGRREYKFGIVNYDESNTDDDWLSNLADELQSDYNVELDMAVADEKYSNVNADGSDQGQLLNCINKWVEEAEKLKQPNGTVEGLTQSDYAANVNSMLEKYLNAKEKADKCENALTTYLNKQLDLNGGELINKIDGNVNGKPDSKNIKLKLIRYCRDSKEYFTIFQKYYSNNGGSDDQIRKHYGQYGKLFLEYRNAKNDELDAKDVYDKYQRRAYGDQFLINMYSIIVIGPSITFSPYRDGNGATDLSLKASQYIRDYVAAGGDLLFFHDTMSPYSKQGGGSYNLTTTLLDAVGMNRFHVDLTDKTKSYVDTGNGYEYKNSDSTYYLTPYAYNATGNNLGLQTSSVKNSVLNSLNKNKMPDNYKNDVLSYNGTNLSNEDKFPDIQVSALSMSYLYFAIDPGLHAFDTTPYLYAKMHVENALMTTANWGNQDESQFSQTANARQLNKGLITMYPFNIGSTLNISGTHQQAYSLDLENTKTTVWYTLSGCNNAKDKSSLYAASPYDAMESYYIYTSAYGKGSITYCGAGHSSVTGKYTKNNDERKLFINVIINSAVSGKKRPGLTLYKPNTDYSEELDTDKLKTTSNGSKIYEKTVSSKNEAPSFDLNVNIPSGINISEIKVYYDLDYDVDNKPNPQFNEETDHMIRSYTQIGDTPISEITSDIKLQIREGKDVYLAPQESYFAPYGGTYTFIAVEVTTADGSKIYAMIKVKAGDILFDLTQNTIGISNNDYVGETKYRFS